VTKYFRNRNINTSAYHTADVLKYNDSMLFWREVFCIQKKRHYQQVKPDALLLD